MLKKDEMLRDLESRFEEAFLTNSRFFNQLLDATRYAVPSTDGLNVLYQYDDGGKYLNYDIHNNTTQIAADQRASQFHSLLLPSGTKWIEIYDNGNYDDVTSKSVYEILQKSNISSVAHSMFLDLTIGCAGVWVDSYSEYEPLVFKNITGVAILPEYTDDCKQDNVWFRRTISKIQAEKYGCKNADEDKNHITCGFILNRDKDNNPIYNVKGCENKKWLYITILNDNWSEPLQLEARKYKQLHVINDTIRPGEARGRGIALKMLNDIMYLNEISRDLKRAIKMKANPPILGNSKVGGMNFSNMSGAILPSTLAQDGIPLLQPMQWDIDIQSIKMQEQSMEEKIQEAFNVSPYGNVNQPPAKTATEINARESNYQRQSTTDISRLVYDLDGLFNTCMQMLQDRGIVPKGKDISFKNPLVLSEYQEQLNNLVTYRQVMNQVVDPQAAVMFNDPNAIDNYVKDKLLIPKTLNSSAQQKQQMNASMQQMAQQQRSAPTDQPQALQPTQLNLKDMAQSRGYGV
jgi:hypothetical protein